MAVVYARRTFALQKNVTALMTKIIIMFSSIAFEINSDLIVLSNFGNEVFNGVRRNLNLMRR